MEFSEITIRKNETDVKFIFNNKTYSAHIKNENNRIVINVEADKAIERIFVSKYFDIHNEIKKIKDYAGKRI